MIARDINAINRYSRLKRAAEFEQAFPYSVAMPDNENEPRYGRTLRLPSQIVAAFKAQADKLSIAWQQLALEYYSDGVKGAAVIQYTMKPKYLSCYLSHRRRPD